MDYTMVHLTDSLVLCPMARAFNGEKSVSMEEEYKRFGWTFLIIIIFYDWLNMLERQEHCGTLTEKGTLGTESLPGIVWERFRSAALPGCKTYISYEDDVIDGEHTDMTTDGVGMIGQLSGALWCKKMQ